jgi:hypothetical protein
VAQLLREFVDEAWLADFDLDGMERLNAKHYAGTGESRHGDMIWRISRNDGQDSYLVLLLEFQSTSEQRMALRMLAYAALLWQRLAQEHRLPPNGMMPPLLPLVLYNGDSRWNAKTCLRKLIALPEDSPIWRWQPDICYYLMDAGAFSDAELKARDGLPALLFRLEAAGDERELAGIVKDMRKWVDRHPESATIRSVLNEMLNALVASRTTTEASPTDFFKEDDMLETRVEQWKHEWLREGREEGRQEGRQEGEVTLLLRVLEHRFGPLPNWAAERVLAAESPQLEQWAVRALDATSLEDALAETLQ